MTLHFYWTFLETQKGPNYWYEQSFIVWCLLRQKNGGWNSGQKPATIVTDAFLGKDLQTPPPPHYQPILLLCKKNHV